MSPPTLDHTAQTYIAVHLSPSSSYRNNPSTLANIHSGLSYVGHLGELEDVLLVAIPKAEWDVSQSQALEALKRARGVTKVEVQEVRQRAKRNRDDF